MTNQSQPFQLSSVFVTGATGLLGNNLVRLLVSHGIRVKALARSREKAETQFSGLPVAIIQGDMHNVAGFAQHLRETDVLFHTAAYFRDSYKGGRHKNDLLETNVRGTVDLLSQAYSVGVRRVVHTSSTNVLTGTSSQFIDETMRRSTGDADDYALSKILAEPGIPPATFSVVDARDVAEAMWSAAIKGQRGERYLAAGRHIEMAELFAVLEKISGVPAPTRAVPMPLLYALASVNELWHFLTRKPALISFAGVRFMARSRNRTYFNSGKCERELGVYFRSVEETVRDTISWYRQNGWCGDSGSSRGLRW
jgi:dihydroflavonol-4-reductase